jgi:hypothetical protein
MLVRSMPSQFRQHVRQADGLIGTIQLQPAHGQAHFLRFELVAVGDEKGAARGMASRAALPFVPRHRDEDA